jgi:hypothetical protein
VLAEPDATQAVDPARPRRDLADELVRRCREVRRHLHREDAAAPEQGGQQLRVVRHPVQERVREDHVDRRPVGSPRRGIRLDQGRALVDAVRLCQHLGRVVDAGELGPGKPGPQRREERAGAAAQVHDAGSALQRHAGQQVDPRP